MSKTNRNFTNTDNHLTELIDNALDFIKEAANGFDKKPKYSLINFSSGIELILKSRLMHEHWSLIVEGIPNLDKFNNGDFISINFRKLCPRIESVTKEKLQKDVIDCFNKIANHRNLTIHFYNKAHNLTNDESNKIREDIYIEQANAWLYLKGLFKKWDDIFSPYKGEIESIDELMIKNNKYLLTLYEKLKPIIDEEKKRGTKILICPSCRYETAAMGNKTSHLIELECLLCKYHSGYFVRTNCYSCQAENIYPLEAIAADELVCVQCGEVVKNDIFEEITTEYSVSGNEHSFDCINCGYCDSRESVIIHNNYYICHSCSAVDKVIIQCGCCSEYVIGCETSEDETLLYGCGFCCGHYSRLIDKDN